VASSKPYSLCDDCEEGACGWGVGGDAPARRSDRLPETLEDTLAGGVLWVVNQRLLAGELGEIRALLPEALEFLLRPYVGEDEAAREAGTVEAASA
jgi:hypothetical protein